MNIEQIYTGCLSEATYFIKSNNEAAIIDPLRETNTYLAKLKEEKATLKYIFITHFHADFVSGHVDLANKTGATIVFGPNAEAEFKFYQAKDQEILNLGELTIKVLHTPGHTLESTCYLLFDREEREHCIFTGDTLFIGDVGRPDLAVKSDLSQSDLAKLLYQSINDKILPLHDDVIIYPSHGAGSACGKNMSKETFDTLGHQKKVNYALNSKLDAEDFVKEVTCGLSTPPQYFPVNVKMNKSINKPFEQILEEGLNSLNPEKFKQEMADSIVIDCRKPAEFAEAHIPGSIFIGIDGGFAPWAGAVLSNIHQKILLVGDPNRVEEAVTRLARVGIDNTVGHLAGGMNSWTNAGFKTESVRSIDAKTFEKETNKNIQIIDVRNNGEYERGHLVQSIYKPLDNITENIKDYNKEENYHIHCQGGYRSMIACSILKSKNIHNVTDIQGGFAAISMNTKLPIEEGVYCNS